MSSRPACYPRSMSDFGLHGGGDSSRGRYNRLGSGAGAPGSVRIDALGLATALRSEALTACCLLILATCASGFILYILRPVLVPFALAVAMMYLLQPVVNFLTRPPRRWCAKCFRHGGERCCESLGALTRSRLWDDEEDERSQDTEAAVLLGGRPHRRLSCLDAPLIPRWLAVIFSIVIALTLFIFLGIIVYQSILSLEGNLQKYEVGANEVVDELRKYLADFSYDLDVEVVPWALRRFRESLPIILALVIRGIEMSIFVTIMLSYLLISPHKPIPSSVWGSIDLHIRRYIRLKTWICFLAGLSCGSILWCLNVELSWVFGLITFVFNFLPNIGPLVATFLPMPIVVLDPDLSLGTKFMAFLLPTLVHLIIGNLIEPRVFGESFELSPVVVLLSLAFWGTLWGLPGMVLSVPLLVCARITFLHLSHPYAAAAAAMLEGNIFESVSDIKEGLMAAAADASVVGAYGAASGDGLSEGEVAQGTDQPSSPLTAASAATPIIRSP